MAAQSRNRARQARNMARKTQLQGEAFVLYTTRVPWPSQYLHLSVAIPIVFDRSHCILRMSSWWQTQGLSRSPWISTAESNVLRQRKTSTNSNYWNMNWRSTNTIATRYKTFMFKILHCP